MPKYYAVTAEDLYLIISTACKTTMELGHGPVAPLSDHMIQFLIEQGLITELEVQYASTIQS